MIYDVAIIGGGITGSAIARELMRYRLRVILIEKEREIGAGTSKANSGIIHAGHHSHSGTLKGQLEWAGNQMWDELHADLDFGFRRGGELTVAMEPEQVAVLHELKADGDAKGVTGLEIWDQARTRKEEPNLSPTIIASLYAPTSGIINPYEACYSLIENAVRNGLELSLENAVIGIEPQDDVIVINTQKGPIATRYCVNAAGLFSDEVAAMAGAGNFTVRPRKGEEYLLDKRLKGIVRHTIFPLATATSKGILVIPTFDGTIMVGPTAQFVDSKYDRTTSAAGFNEVFDSVRKLVPGISPRDCIAQFAGLRAVLESEDFLIGPSSVRGFINLAGIQSPGLTSAPAIAQLVANILADEGLRLEHNDSFNPKNPKRVRFAALSRQEQMQLVAADPRYGRIVCRCELVTEGEIVDAIHAGARTLDGVKFRTRAGMGRCQGGFCSARVMELLSRELNVPFTSITKRGGDSWIITDRIERG
jgi:glycerol-3-phosphate dehydrogenase